jgi:hypothetical protein
MLASTVAAPGSTRARAGPIASVTSNPIAADAGSSTSRKKFAMSISFLSIARSRDLRPQRARRCARSAARRPRGELPAERAAALDAGALGDKAKALAALARAGEDEARGRALLQEGQQLLAQGSVSHAHLEFHLLAIEFLLDAGDQRGAVRHADALAEYTRTEPLPWADVVIARARTLVDAANGRRDRSDEGTLREVLERVERMDFGMPAPRLRAALQQRG